MTTNSFVSLLKQEYDQHYQNGIYLEEPVKVNSYGSIVYDRFVGSEKTISMISRDILLIDAPGCVAAPTVNIMAKNQISLGMKGRKGEHLPTRLFASELLTMTTYYLEIGVVELYKPSILEGAIYCSTLNMYKPIGDTDPEYFEIFESLVIREATEINKIASPDLINKTDANKSNDDDFY